MFIDLDGFKSINDNYGHDSGDILLKTVAQRLKDLIRRNDFLARIGGDEFVIIYTDIKEDKDNVHLAKLILEALKDPINLTEGNIGHVGGSIGIATYPKHGTNIETLLKAADDAMYVAKQNGKNGFELA